MTTRRGRGAATEHLIAEHWRNNGWPYATVRRGPGTDLENTPGLDVEIKARRDFVPTLWLRQAERRQDGLPIVIVRPDGMGPTTIGGWVAVMRHQDLIALLHAAGYGTPTDTANTSSRLTAAEAEARWYADETEHGPAVAAAAQSILARITGPPPSDNDVTPGAHS